MIHPTAVIHPGAQVDSTVRIAPYAVIDERVVVGPHCRLGPHVYLTGNAIIGAHNEFHAGCVVGDAPQDIKYKGEATGLRIGDHNVFREHVTVHRSSKADEETVIGSNNLLMAHSHIGHNVRLGNHIILANGALLGGYAVVDDRVFISGHCLLHQFVRVGTLALMQGSAGISQDLPPFTVAQGHNGICGLNTVGLRRAGFTSQERLELKALYHALFRSGQSLRVALQAAQNQFSSPAARTLLEFIATSKRGICRDVSRRDSEMEAEG